DYYCQVWHSSSYNWLF
nr:immunoglobulin light chain junction region [Macaca mulatta]